MVKNLVNHDFVKNWINWDQLMTDKKQLELMASKGYMKAVPG